MIKRHFPSSKQLSRAAIATMTLSACGLVLASVGCESSNFSQSEQSWKEPVDDAKPETGSQDATASDLSATALTSTGSSNSSGTDAGLQVQDGTDSGKGSQKTSATRWIQDTFKNASDSSSEMAAGSLDWANETFQSLKDQGLTTAESTGEWLTEDWQNMESWEYKIVKIDSLPESSMEDELNQLGRKGWECFSVNDGRMFFKRPRESYLRRLPFKDLLRLAPLLNQGK